jgi:hypothetical protein
MTQPARSHSEIIRTMGIDVPLEAQDYDSQEYLDWLGTVPAANAEIRAPVIHSEIPEFRQVVDEKGKRWTIFRGWWR